MTQWDQTPIFKIFVLGINTMVVRGGFLTDKSYMRSFEYVVAMKKLSNRKSKNRCFNVHASL